MTHPEATDQFSTVAGQVAAVWQRTLNLGRAVPWDAGFVSLGGNSLLLYSILDEVEETFGVELDVNAVVADLTVNGMAKAILTSSRDHGRSDG